MAHAVDIDTGAALRQYTASEAGVPTSVEGSHDGRLLFATSPHKAMLAFDLRCRAATCLHCRAGTDPGRATVCTWSLPLCHATC